MLKTRGHSVQLNAAKTELLQCGLSRQIAVTRSRSVAATFNQCLWSVISGYGYRKRRHYVNAYQQGRRRLLRDPASASQYSQITEAGDIDQSRGQPSADPRGLLQRSRDWPTVNTAQ